MQLRIETVDKVLDGLWVGTQHALATLHFSYLHLEGARLLSKVSATTQHACTPTVIVESLIALTLHLSAS